MSRIITSGAEWGVTVADVANAPDGKLVQGATPQFNVSATAAYVRSGVFGWRMTPSAAAGNFGYAEFVPTALNFFATTYWFRVYFKRISGTPITAPGDPFFHVYDSTGPFLQLMMDTSGRLVVRNVVAAVNALVGGQIDDGQWHRVEVSYNMPSTSGNTTVDCYLDGTRVGTGYSGNMRNLSANGCRLGATAVSSTVLDWALDDFALNDDGGTQQNSRPGDGKIVLLKPIGDTAVGAGWTAGGGATTGLFNAIDNSPPVGVTDPGTNTSQIRNATSTAVANYDATLTSYTTAGIGASDTIQLCQWCINHGTASATSPPVRAVQLTSNPAEAGETTLSSPTAVAGTFPTNWLWQIGPVTYVPTVTKGTSPVMRVGKRTASTRIVDVDAMGLYVEYLPVGGILNKRTISSSLTVSPTVQKKARKPVTRSVAASPTIVRKARKPINRSMVISPTVVRKAQKSVNRSLAMNLGMNLGKKYSKRISAPLLFGGAGASYEATILATPNLAHYLRLNGDTTALVGPNGTLTENPLVLSSYVASVLRGGGSALHTVPYTQTYISAAKVISSLATGITLECWVNIMGPTSHGYLVKIGGDADGVALCIGAGNADAFGRELLGLFEGVAWRSGSAILADGWHHVAWTIDPGSNPGSIFYVDGVQVASWLSGGPTPKDPIDGLYIGGYLAYNRYFAGTEQSGEIDEPAVYTRPLTAAEIQNHYYVGNYRNVVRADAPWGYWRLNAFPIAINGSFETDVSGWADSWGGPNTVARTTAQSHGGSGALQLTRGSAGGWGVTYDTPPDVVGRSFGYTAWVKVTAAITVRTQVTDFVAGQSNDIAISPGDGWVQVTAMHPNPAGTARRLQIDCLGGAAGDVLYVDDVAVSALDSADLGSANHSAKAYSGAKLNAAGLLASDIDKAIDFDGVSGWVEIDHGLVPAWNPRAWSIEFWVKINGPAQGPLVVWGRQSWHTPSGYATSSGIGIGIGLGGDFRNGPGRELEAYADYIGHYMSSGFQLTDGIHHVVVTGDDYLGGGGNTGYRFYVDGVAVGAYIQQVAPTAPNDMSSIGGYRSDDTYPSFGVWTNVIVDEVALYPYLLTPAQIAAHHNAGIGVGAVSGPTLSLKFLRGRAISAGLTIQSTLARKASRKFSRPLTLSGTVAKKARISRPRALTITSTLARKSGKRVGAPLSLSVSVGRAKTFRRAISASSALSAALARRVRLTRSRPLTLTGSNVRKLRLSRSRTLSLTASIGRKERMSISRSLVFSLNLAKKRRTVLVRTLNFTLPDTMKVKKALSTATTMVSTLTPRKIAGAPGVRLIQVSLITAPTIKRKAQLRRSLSLGTTPTVNRRTKFKLTRSLSFSFVLQKRRFRAFTRTLTMTNTISRKPGKKVQRSLTISPNLKRRASLTTRATLQHSLALKRKVRMTQTLVLSLPASEKLKTAKRLTRSLTLTAKETHATIGRRFALAVQLKLNPAVTPSKKQSRLMQVALRLTSKLSARKRRETGQLTTIMHRPTILRTTKKPEILSADGSKATDIERVK